MCKLETSENKKSTYDNWLKTDGRYRGTELMGIHYTIYSAFVYV